MLPMSLYESEESNGTVSLSQLFAHPDNFDGCRSDLTIDGLIFALCRGGWPGALSGSSDAAKLEVAKDLFRQTVHVDISNIDMTKRNPLIGESVLRSYARNICTLAGTKTILADIRANHSLSDSTYYEYISALEKLFIVNDIAAWCPSIRSKTAIRASAKRNLIDPSIAVAALGVGPSYFNTDFKTLGFLFESLCVRDLKAYSLRANGSVSYYRDRYGLESDIVLHLDDGRYALIEVKLGDDGVEDGASHLLEIEALVASNNERETQVPIRMPDLKIVLTGAEYGYKREDGVLVIPIGCLKD
jgi:predicted AAA+ superfamily ATPase